MHFNVYPNPSSGIVYVDLNGSENNYTYSLTDILGRTVKSGKLTTTLHFENLNSAIYFLKIVDLDTNKFYIKKIILNN